MSDDSEAVVEALSQNPGDVLRALRDRVTKALTDSSRNNPLLYFRDNRSTRFTIAPFGSRLVTALLSGEPIRRSDFERDCPQLTRSTPTQHEATEESYEGSSGSARVGRWRPESSTDPLMKRLSAIKAKDRENQEERGLRTLFAAIGMVSWPAADGGRAPCAPLFLVHVSVESDKRAREELVVTRVADSEILVNRALLTVGPPAFCEAIQKLFADGLVDDVATAYSEVQAAIGAFAEIALQPTAALGIFNFALMAMIEDLHQSGEALAEHIVIRALAGDPIAQQTLSAGREGVVDVASLDAIPPVNEPFVLDADPWQGRTIQTILQYPDSNASVDGPPGTGKSQTIANLIAALIAKGHSVLFVCEKRAALEVVKRRLGNAGLGHLILDLHGADVTRQKVYAQLREASRKLRDALPASTAFDTPLETTRERLNAHVRFMHTPRGALGLSPYQLLSELTGMPPFDLSLRLSAEELAEITPPLLSQLESGLREAARFPSLFLRSPDAPWACSSLRPEAIPEAIDGVAAVPALLTKLRLALAQVGVAPRTRAELSAAVSRLLSLRATLADCGPGALSLDKATLELARDTLRSPFGGLLQLFSGERRSAVRAVRAHLRSDSRERCVAAMTTLLALEEPWRAGATAVAAMPAEIFQAAERCTEDLASVDAALGVPAPEELDAASKWAERCASDRDGAYRAARMREIERDLVAHHLGAIARELRPVLPAAWPTVVRYVVLQSHLEPLRPALMRIDGRTQDDVVASFARLEAELRDVSRDRVLRAAGERHIELSRKEPDQFVAVDVQVQKVRPRKPLRALYTEAPQAMLALAPCVMASPLSISQFLPRASIFDVVVFDEGSQVTPESAITAILRGRRVVIAGDERQLPPTDFFRAANDDDDDDDDDGVATAGTESILQALRPFTKELGLRVHYRSRDERLIAFSNHYLYGDELITFPGSGIDAQGLRFEFVDLSGSEIDEESSGPEVRRVVDLILEHARTRPNESLGVIALGSPHARRVENALNVVRRESLDPDVESFFGEDGVEPFFIKNLERVQGDERDAIILTIGYGRTKTGAVSHNFGPINKAGGERRLNVAVTRAKSRLTLVAGFRKVDLNPTSLNSRGARLLAAYLGYAESGGRDLGRDRADVSVPPNAFERDIQQALEQRLKTGIVPQYGVGQFRIDLAVQSPNEPGRFVLAVECDGATYHSTPTARMRDRLRQRVLEDLGWHFCRVWSTDWFNERERELDRIEAAYRKALANLSEPRLNDPNQKMNHSPATSTSQNGNPRRQGSSPARPPYRSINDVSDRTLRDLFTWIGSDGRLRTNDDIVNEMVRELGFSRRGARIVDRITNALRVELT
jgi:very-short-patch-repair endonuclease